MEITRRQKRSTIVITRRDPKADRHQKFSARRKKMIYAALESDLPIVRACALAGIEYVTYRKWLDLGRNSQYPAFYAFRKRCLKIEAKKEMEALSVVKKCAAGGHQVGEIRMSDTYRGKETHRSVKTVAPQWTAAAWFLERRYPKEYGRNIPIDETDSMTDAEKTASLKEALHEMISTVPDGGLPVPAGPDEFYSPEEDEDEEENGYTNGLDI